MRGRLTICLVWTALIVCSYAQSSKETNGRLVSVGDYRLFINCSGPTNSSPAVVLLSGGGSTSEIWKKVQPGVSPFARVCSYDREGMGKSDTHIPIRQTAAQIGDDLHMLLANAGVPPPYVLVGHSIGGIYARQFAVDHPSEVAGLVFVDSADEEQVWRFERISHSLLFEYKSWPNYGRLREEGYLPPGALLQWRQDVPLIVLEHGITWPQSMFRGMTDSQYEETKKTWDMMQRDLASRSKCSRFQVAEKSGHYIHIDQPELVVDAIREASTMTCPK